MARIDLTMLFFILFLCFPPALAGYQGGGTIILSNGYVLHDLGRARATPENYPTIRECEEKTLVLMETSVDAAILLEEKLGQYCKKLDGANQEKIILSDDSMYAFVNQELTKESADQVEKRLEQLAKEMEIRKNSTGAIGRLVMEIDNEGKILNYTKSLHSLFSGNMMKGFKLNENSTNQELLAKGLREEASNNEDTQLDVYAQKCDGFKIQVKICVTKKNIRVTGRLYDVEHIGEIVDSTLRYYRIGNSYIIDNNGKFFPLHYCESTNNMYTCVLSDSKCQIPSGEGCAITEISAADSQFTKIRRVGEVSIVATNEKFYYINTSLYRVPSTGVVAIPLDENDVLKIGRKRSPSNIEG